MSKQSSTEPANCTADTAVPDAADLFGSTLDEYRPRLVRYLELRTGSHADASDLAQEAYFRLCRVKDPQLIRQPDSYLFRIASNLLSEFMLHKRKRAALVALDAEVAGFEEGDQESFCAQLETRSEIEKLNAVLSDLPPLYRAILLMRKRDGYSHKEIAERLSVSPHTVQKYLTRALLHCRTTWAEKYEY